MPDPTYEMSAVGVSAFFAFFFFLCSPSSFVPFFRLFCFFLDLESCLGSSSSLLSVCDMRPLSWTPCQSLATMSVSGDHVSLWRPCQSLATMSVYGGQSVPWPN